MKTIRLSMKYLFVAVTLISFCSAIPLENNLNSTSQNFDKTKRLLVEISCFDCQNGQGTLTAHHPTNPNLHIYSGHNYEVNWYTNHGDLYAANTHQVPVPCGQRVYVVVTDQNGNSGGDGYDGRNCRY